MRYSKMRGIADPYSLGIIISILGTIVVSMIHDPAPEPDEMAGFETPQTTQVREGLPGTMVSDQGKVETTQHRK